MPEVDRGEWMQTFSGVKFHFGDPRPEDVRIEDIAHALSMICRFGGHVRSRYSVAEHSVRVAECVAELGGTPDEVFWGLMHDAAEAYVGDVVWPLKRAPELASYAILERRVELAVCKAFRMSYDMPAIVKHADLVMLATEKRDLMRGGHTTVEREAIAAKGETDEWYCDDAQPHPKAVVGWSAYDAKVMFLTAFRSLAGHLRGSAMRGPDE